jgi:hypothetical protein
MRRHGGDPAFDQAPSAAFIRSVGAMAGKPISGDSVLQWRRSNVNAYSMRIFSHFCPERRME